MPGPLVEIRIEGAERIKAKAGPQLFAKAVRNFLGKSALVIERRAKELTPVDTGRLRASFSHSLDAAQVPLWARVGSSVKYAPFVENDTRPHFPPLSAIEGWAHRHGMIPFLVARAISKRGTKGKHMLKRAFEESQQKIKSLLNQMGREIKEDWEK